MNVKKYIFIINAERNRTCARRIYSYDEFEKYLLLIEDFTQIRVFYCMF